MSGSVTSRAGWVESSESNSFHTYLMLVTVAETLRRVIELMRYLRKCIFFFTKKYHMMREGEPLMGSFHTRKLSFFLQRVVLAFFSRLAIRSAFSRDGVCPTPGGRDLPPLLIPNVPRPGAPGVRRGHLYPERDERRGREEKPDCRNRDRNRHPPPTPPPSAGGPGSLRGWA